MRHRSRPPTASWSSGRCHRQTRRAPEPGEGTGKTQYNGHDPTYEQFDAHQIAQGEQKGGYHEFFRILMRAVADQKIGDPGAWDEPADNSFDPALFFGAPKQTIPTNTEYGGWSWFAGVPGAYAKAFATK